MRLAALGLVVGLALIVGHGGADEISPVVAQVELGETAGAEVEAEHGSQFPGPFSPAPPPAADGTGGYYLKMNAYNNLDTTPYSLDCGGTGITGKSYLDDLSSTVPPPSDLARDGFVQSYGPGRSVGSMHVTDSGNDDNDGVVPDLAVCREKCNSCAGCAGFIDMMEEGNCYFMSQIDWTMMQITSGADLYKKYWNKVKSYAPCTPGHDTAGQVELVKNDGSECSACTPGMFQSKETMDMLCLSCPPGRFADEAATPECKVCAAGFYANTDKIACIQCSGSQFAVAETQGACTNCPRGHYGTEAGLTDGFPPVGGLTDANIHEGVNVHHTCMPCAPGLYTPGDSTGSSACLECIPGRFAGFHSQQQACKICLAGRYAADNIATTCEACSAGKSTKSLDHQTVCVDCEVGQYTAEAGIANCADCPKANSTRGDVEQTHCFLCIAGKYADVFGSSECKGCQPGFFSTEHSEVCQSCLPGYYSGMLQQDTCLTCPSGFYQDVEERTACHQCSAGRFGEEDATSTSDCETCPAGYWQDEPEQTENNCKECPQGYHQDNDGAQGCLICPDGSYQEETAAVQCKSCVIGKKSNPDAALPSLTTACGDCEPGKYTSAIAQASCIDCNQGRHANNAGGAGAGATDCVTCGSGYYSAAQSTSCLNCEVGEHSQAGWASCRDCPSGYFGGSINSEECDQCPSGWLVPNDGSPNSFKQSTCVFCMNGKYSEWHTAGTTACLPCQKGTYSHSSEAASLTAPACKQCVAGQFAQFTETAACLNCPAGYIVAGTGESHCFTCTAGQYQDESGTTSCKLCAGGEYSVDGPNTSCNSCPQGHSTDADGDNGSPTAPQDAELCTLCSIGHYADAGSSICTTCSAGLVASAGSLACSTCPSGFSAGEELGESLEVGNVCDGGNPPSWCGLCTSCAAGKQSNPNNPSAGCQDCPGGRFSAGVENECEECAIGKLMQGTGATACADCAAGKYADATGTGSDANPICKACIVGHYSPENDAISPHFCPECPAGQVSGNNHAKGSPDLCNKCAVGRYIEDGVNANTCKAVPSGRYQDEQGATWYKNSPAGFYVQTADTAPTSCPAGWHSGDNQIQCTACPMGYHDWLDSGTSTRHSCKACGSGTFIPYPMSTDTACKLCPSGYIGYSGQSACKDCEAGKRYSGSAPAATCESCSAGQYTDLGSKANWAACVRSNQCKSSDAYCRVGDLRCITDAECDYSNTMDSTSRDCTRMPKGGTDTGVIDTSCTTCPSGHSAPGSSSSTCDVCGSGYYSSSGSSSCQMCAERQQPDGNPGTACTACPSGKYRDTNGGSGWCESCTSANKFGVDGECRNCPAGWDNTAGGEHSSCSICPGGDPGEYSPGAGQSCAACPSGYAQPSNSQTSCIATVVSATRWRIYVTNVGPTHSTGQMQTTEFAFTDSSQNNLDVSSASGSDITEGNCKDFEGVTDAVGPGCDNGGLSPSNLDACTPQCQHDGHDSGNHQTNQGGSMPQWWSYTFSSSVSPSYIVLADADSGSTMASRYPSKFQPQWSSDGSTWNSCSEITINSNDGPFGGMKYLEVTGC